LGLVQGQLWASFVGAPRTKQRKNKKNNQIRNSGNELNSDYLDSIKWVPYNNSANTAEATGKEIFNGTNSITFRHFLNISDM